MVSQVLLSGTGQEAVNIYKGLLGITMLVLRRKQGSYSNCLHPLCDRTGRIWLCLFYQEDFTLDINYIFLKGNADLIFF